MLRLSFLSRVAFICNVSLVLAWLLRYLPISRPGNLGSLLNTIMEIGLGTLVGMILSLGLLFSFVINPVVNIWYAVVLVRRQPLRAKVPVWLAIINFIFFIVQLYLVI
ncbi:MAG TPA: hypothetical protein VEB42_10825 [Chitinophagaceae bacterium]|nr:hypothetical protein [Chitinophagaceae bacterium]